VALEDELQRAWAAAKAGLLAMRRHALQTARERRTAADGRRSRISVTTSSFRSCGVASSG
jgi:hypothetical protein